MIDGTLVSPRGEEDVEGEGGAEDMVALPVAVRRKRQEPTLLERETHSKAHVPYRAWCEFCEGEIG